MKRIRLRAANTTLIVVASLAAGSTVSGCIPSPDTSGLPPYDASVLGLDDGAFAQFDAGLEDAPSVDAAEDVTTTPDAPVAQTGTINGVVVNYSQGLGRGVVPGATVTVVGGQTTTTDAFGAFVLQGVTAGQVQIEVTKTTDQTAGVAYSSTQAVVTLGASQTVSVFPVLHQGCYEKVTLATTNAPVATSDAAARCGALTGSNAGVYAAIQFDATALVNPSTANSLVPTGTVVRVEMIPMGFPDTASEVTDFTWSLGLPGGGNVVETVGATEFRIVDDQSGAPLAIASGDTSVTMTLPTWKLASDTTYREIAYAAGAGVGQWVVDTGTVGSPRTMQVGDAPQIDVVQVTDAHALGWVAIQPTSPAPTTCLTGALTASGNPAPGVWVRLTGLNYFGTASAVTDSNGTFCVDVKASSDGGTVPQVGVAAGYATTTAGAFLTIPTSGVQVSALAGGTCAQQSGCTAMGQVALTPYNATCVNGTVAFSDGGAPTDSLDVELVVPKGIVSAGQAYDGITSTAYIGTTTPGDAGAFCAEAPAGSIELVDQASGCGTSDITVKTGGALATCSGSACSAVGAVALTCAPPP